MAEQQLCRGVRTPSIRLAWQRAAGLAVAVLALVGQQAVARAQPSQPPPSQPPPSQPPPTPQPAPAPAATAGAKPAPAVQQIASPTNGRAAALALHDEAQQLYQQGLYPQAIAKLEAAIDYDPDAIVLHYNLGLIYEKMGQLDKALEHFHTCLDLEHNPVERIRLERIIARLSGARLHQREAAANRHHGSPHEQPSPPATPPSDTSSVHPVVIGASVVAASGLLLGGGLALYAYVRDPGRHPTTSATIHYADLQDDADAAHAAAIGADVALVVGTVAATTAISVAIAWPGGSAAAPQTTLRLTPNSANLVLSF